MTDHEIVDSSFTATINAPLEKIDLPQWADAEQRSSLASGVAR